MRCTYTFTSHVKKKEPLQSRAGFRPGRLQAHNRGELSAQSTDNNLIRPALALRQYSKIKR
jgi:hypothetical protein